MGKVGPWPMKTLVMRD